MNKYYPVRLLATSKFSTDTTKCFVFVDELKKARCCIEPHSGIIVAAYPFINAFGVHCNVHKLSDLKSLPCVKAIAPHTTVTTTMLREKSLINLTTARSSIGYGKGVGVAVIDTGVSPHLDFMIPKKRVRFVDFIGGKKRCYDDNGHGTAVASILCGNGLVSGGTYSGVAPLCNLVALKAIGNSGEGGAFAILEAMQWLFDNAQKYGIRVVCMSFGADPVISGTDPLSLGAEALWKKGIVVVASAGNDGPKPSTIKSPGINPNIITVGGAEITLDDNGVENVTIPDFSSRGPAGKYIKPDIVAPSVDIMAASIDADSFYEKFTGTSMAAPIIAGAAALILAHNPQFSPDKVKETLLSMTKKLPHPQNDCGKGLFAF